MAKNKPPRSTEKAIWRLMDANINRTREALRILEDTARFVLGRGGAANALRAMRHDFDASVRSRYKQLLGARDVEGDSGRANVSRAYKGGVEELLKANFKRCEEALRVLEEYGRLLSPSTTAKMQALRFKVYQQEKKML